MVIIKKLMPSADINPRADATVASMTKAGIKVPRRVPKATKHSAIINSADRGTMREASESI